MTNEYNAARQILWVPTRSAFAFAYAAGGRGTYSGSYVYDLTDVGVPSGGYPIGDYPSFGLRGSGDVLIVHSNSDGMRVSRYYGSGLDAGTLLSEGSLYQRIAVSGSQSAVIYRNSSTETIRWVTVTSLVEGTAIHLDLTGQYPDIAAVLPGFAVAWAVAAGVRFQILTTAGAQLCAANVSFGNGALDYGDAVAIASTEYGTLVLATDSGGTEARLFRLDNSCNLLDSAAVSSVSEATSVPAIAVGGGYVALAWQKYHATSPADSYVRILGERLCN